MNLMFEKMSIKVFVVDILYYTLEKWDFKSLLSYKVSQTCQYSIGLI